MISLSIGLYLYNNVLFPLDDITHWLHILPRLLLQAALSIITKTGAEFARIIAFTFT